LSYRSLALAGDRSENDPADDRDDHSGNDTEDHRVRDQEHSITHERTRNGYPQPGHPCGSTVGRHRHTLAQASTADELQDASGTNEAVSNGSRRRSIGVTTNRKRELQQTTLFDRFAEASSEFASHASFFIGCALVVLLWLPSYFLIRSISTWQLIINTLTTIITFLLVALLQNSQRRSEQAVQEKLDALADGLADLMVAIGADDSDKLKSDVADLRDAVGLEQTS